jgi:hypothetical protein
MSLKGNYLVKHLICTEIKLSLAKPYEYHNLKESTHLLLIWRLLKINIGMKKIIKMICHFFWNNILSNFMRNGMVLNKLLYHLFHRISVRRSTLTRKFIEEFIEMGKVVKATLKTNVSNRHLAF